MKFIYALIVLLFASVVQAQHHGHSYSHHYHHHYNYAPNYVPNYYYVPRYYVPRYYVPSPIYVYPPAPIFYTYPYYW